MENTRINQINHEIDTTNIIELPQANTSFLDKCFSYDIDTEQLPINYCFYSSFIFIANVVVFYCKSYYLYSILFLLLFATSVCFHSNKNIATFIIDKISIICVVLYGGYVFFEKYCKIETVEQSIYASLIISSFIITLYLYYYGYNTDTYCFSKNKINACLWHSLIHVISCIGHIFIVLM